MEGDGFFLDGERIGHRSDFRSFLDAHGLDLSKFDPPDAEVILIDKDVYCPLRKRIVLYAGCVYGAPLYTTRICHVKRPMRDKNLLSNLIADAGQEVDLFESELEGKHLAVAARAEPKSVFVYRHADQSLSLNGRHFLKNVPAKILNKILAAYTLKGRREFEYRDFKRDFEISFGRKNSNFEIRFYRLLEKLKQENAGIRIRKRGRGSFTVEAEGTIEYREEYQEAGRAQAQKAA
jgi:hypothetical protein